MGEARRKQGIIAAAVAHGHPVIDGWCRVPHESEPVDPSIRIDPERVAHMRALHRLSGKKLGAVSLMRRVVCKDGKIRFRTHVVQPEDLDTDPYLQASTHNSMNTFFGARKGGRLAQLNCVYVDVDFYSNSGTKHASAESMMQFLEDRLYDARVPSPSYWQDSGRGLLAVWLFEEVPAAAYPLVRAIQKALVGPMQTVDLERLDEREARNAARLAGVWAGCGVDRRATDIPRVFRICGSINEKSGRKVRLLWPSSWDEVQRYTVEYLAETILPYTRGEIADMRLAREAAKVAVEQEMLAREERRAEAAALYGEEEDLVMDISSTGRGRDRFAGGTGRWQRRIDALKALVAWWGGSVPEGRRDLFAFHMACSWAAMGYGDVEVWARTLSPMCGLPVDELRSSLSTVAARLDASRRGEKVEYRGENPRLKGTLIDPRYTPAAATVRDDLDLSIEDIREAGADALIAAAAGASATERSRARRERDGCAKRETTVEKRIADGALAIAMRAAGRTMHEIAAAIGRGLTSLTRAMAEAAARAAAAVIEAVAPQGKTSHPDVHGSAHYLVAKPSPSTVRRTADPGQIPSWPNVVPFPVPKAARTLPEALPDMTLPMPDLNDTPLVLVNPWASAVDLVPDRSEGGGAAPPPDPFVLPSRVGTLGELAKALLAHPVLSRYVRPGSIVERPGKKGRERRWGPLVTSRREAYSFVSPSHHADGYDAPRQRRPPGKPERASSRPG